MSKLVEMVKNSPLMRKKLGGGYAVLESEKKDPFSKGISFNLQYCASAEVRDNFNSPAVQDTVTEARRTGGGSGSLRKVALTVQAHCLTVVDSATKVTDTYPIFLVAYCGGHEDMSDCFYFIHKTKLEKAMRVEVFQCSGPDKVKAITLTVAKAFNISYKAWLIKKKKAEKEKKARSVNGSESPVVQRKAPPGKSPLTTKIAPGVVTGGTYTPPVIRKPPSGPSVSPLTMAAGDVETVGRARSGSAGDKSEAMVKNGVVMRAMTTNDRTGSTHAVLISDDFDREFQQLAEARTQPEMLRTSFTEDDIDGFFDFESIKAHIEDDPN